MTTRILIFSLFFITLSNSVVAQNVNIPDTNFKAALIANPSINVNGDNEIQISEASAFTGTINVNNIANNAKISDLTGISSFTSLQGLNCAYNHLTSLNISSNTSLINLDCTYNQITTLNVSANTALTYLDCSENQLTNLQVSGAAALQTLACNNNQLTSLHVLNVPTLKILWCTSNQLSSLNLSNNSNLVELACYYNNYLTHLDLSANTVLFNLFCSSNNQLTSLNVQNGNNSNISNFDAFNNPNLFCIQVDNVAYSNYYWQWGKDSTASFSNNCKKTTATYNTTDNVQFTFYPNPASDQFFVDANTNDKLNVDLYNVNGTHVFSKSVSDKSNIDVTSLDEGIYTLTIKTADSIINKKLVVVR